MSYHLGQKVHECWGANRRVCTLIKPTIFPSGKISGYWDVRHDDGTYASVHDSFFQPLSALHVLAEAAE